MTRCHTARLGDYLKRAPSQRDSPRLCACPELAGRQVVFPILKKRVDVNQRLVHDSAHVVLGVYREVSAGGAGEQLGDFEN
jgi:hypothetical protein